jgi:hypothetical protein
MNYYHLRYFVKKIKSNKNLSKMSNYLDDNRKHIISYILDTADPDALKADGFDNAIIGITNDGRIVYDIATMRKILMNGGDMTEEEADEYMEFNIFGAYVGELMPVYVNLDRNFFK